MWFLFLFILFYFFHGVCVVVHSIAVHIVKIRLWFDLDLLGVMLQLLNNIGPTSCNGSTSCSGSVRRCQFARNIGFRLPLVIE